MEKLELPITLSSHLLEAMQGIADDNNVPENFGYDTDVQEVEHESRDGFMPFTNGGFDLTLPTDLMTAYGTGNSPSEPKAAAEIERAIDDSLEMALKDFCEENAAQLSAVFTDEEIAEPKNDVISYHSLYELDKGDLAEALSDVEMNYLTEGSAFFYQFRVLFFKADNSRNVSGEDELYFMAGTNTDFEYGRDSGLMLSYEKNVMVKDLTTEMIDEIILDMAISI